MATTYPKDFFDELPTDIDRIGAHRAPTRRGAGWIVFAWAALATGVLVAAGVLAVTLGGGSADDVTGAAVPVASAEPTVEALTDPSTIEASRKITVNVSNGTTTAGLGTAALKALDADGWPVGEADNAKSTAHEVTVVYYGKAADEDVARGVAQALTVGTVKLDDTMTNGPIRVVLGSDYAEVQAAK